MKGVGGNETFILCVCRPYETISSFKGFAFHCPHASVSENLLHVRPFEANKQHWL